jgi:membrane protein implicated in regulation of membrane protease activity
MTWWMWVIGGLALAAIELLTPGSLFWIFFAVGGIVTGACAALFPQWGLAPLSIIFTAVSVLSLAVFRKPLLARLERNSPQGGPVDTIVGETAIALDDILPGAIGKAELRGTAWQARNESGEPIIARERRRVEKVEGLTLFLGRLA